MESMPKKQGHHRKTTTMDNISTLKTRLYHVTHSWDTCSSYSGHSPHWTND
ncbi:type VI secretion system membrane subunit TssM [Sesbania bispinosa]|nr:type VI secretion system membrane subunit TssM [Sesbania bispinosa]